MYWFQQGYRVSDVRTQLKSEGSIVSMTALHRLHIDYKNGTLSRPQTNVQREIDLSQAASQSDQTTIKSVSLLSTSGSFEMDSLTLNNLNSSTPEKPSPRKRPPPPDS